MFDQGVRLQLLIGKKVPKPVTFNLIDALIDLEVENNDYDFDGFKLSFGLTKQALSDYDLLIGDQLEPPYRVVVVVTVGVLPQVLIDGVITRHEIVASPQPGNSTLHVYGRDISQLLDLQDHQNTYANQADSVIVTRLLSQYTDLQLMPQITSTADFPAETERIPSQQGTDLSYIKALAQRNNFVFYVEPTSIPGISTAYWGRENRSGIPQPPLIVGSGSESNLDTPPNFSFNAMAATEPQVSIQESTTRQRIPVSTPDIAQPPLAALAVRPLRQTIPQDTAHLSLSQAQLRALTAADSREEVVTGTGEVDTVRYGHVLQARRLVKVLGAGYTNSGTYYVKQVTHRIRRGEYKQSFQLTREGRGALL